MNNSKLNNKKPYVIAITLAVVLVLFITTTSYAYFVGVVNGSAKNIEITTGSMEIEYTDGPQVSLNNAVPTNYVEKTFKVKNVGTGDTVYDVYMSDLLNDFADKTDLVYTLTSSDGGYNTVDEVQVPDESTKIVNSQVLRSGEEHNYTLRITFKETNDNQDDNKNKVFSCIIRVNEVKETIKTITLNANGGTVSQNIIRKSLNSEIGELPIPTYGDKFFEGWYLESDFQTKVTPTYTVSGDTILYARYGTLINLNLGSRTRGYPSNSTMDSTTKRTYNMNTYVVGLALDNYFSADFIQSYSINASTISVKASSGYGIGLPVTLSQGSYVLLSSLNVNPNTATGIVSILKYRSDGTMYTYNNRQVHTSDLDFRFSIGTSDSYEALVFAATGSGTNLTVTNIKLYKLD